MSREKNEEVAVIKGQVWLAHVAETAAGFRLVAAPGPFPRRCHGNGRRQQAQRCAGGSEEKLLKSIKVVRQSGPGFLSSTRLFGPSISMLAVN